MVMKYVYRGTVRALLRYVLRLSMQKRNGSSLCLTSRHTVHIVHVLTHVAYTYLYTRRCSVETNSILGGECDKDENCLVYVRPSLLTFWHLGN